ncbi:MULTISPECIES: carboxylesterase/lipase family protein [Enterococcus]|uniref:carboxylesterase/lipase family protein n=1 Tax=Enterococcus TaxID=1350 RepID=UPI000A32CBA4|nr:carboxylesterase family protein [Enterococcus faecalis]EGO2704979.1 carboxylesterase/lipase family protein [Enterococcus faecalis]EGO2705210.1 carboxylesterase/lipase family protein [Enterococcus faecalis]EGO8848253.1 carboxylesterase/lipase family protein [Enterococcus faecalis]OTP10720.1 hypothetical protein A5830_002785 [Enterococcus faecalis]
MENILSNTGQYSGKRHKNVQSFLGIPYAEPPIGKLRFKDPQKKNSSSIIPLRAEEYPPNPIQKGNIQINEDCLYLNIWKPAEINNNVPVMVWIYGGSFETGGIGEKGAGLGLTYDGTQLAKDTGCIIVTVNYRLNVFGFLDFSEFSDKFDSNLGIKDVICALEWIKTNIHEFGGNSQNVTLFGQSAGGMLIATLNKVPTAQHLYHKIIIESACIESLYTKEEARELALTYLKLLNLTEKSVDELLTLSPDRLLSVIKKLEEHVRSKMLGITTFCPVIDKKFLTGVVYKGNFKSNKPMIIGSTKNEARLFVKFSKDISEEKGERFFPYSSKETREEIISKYPNFPNFIENSQLATDIMYTIPKYWLADTYSKNNDVYVYRFDFSSGFFKFLNLRASHIVDVPIQFGIGSYLYIGNIHTAKRIGKKIRTSLGLFAKTGNPNDGDSLWKKYSEAQPNVVLINKDIHLENDPDRSTKQLYKNFNSFFHES